MPDIDPSLEVDFYPLVQDAPDGQGGSIPGNEAGPGVVAPGFSAAASLPDYGSLLHGANTDSVHPNLWPFMQGLAVPKDDVEPYGLFGSLSQIRAAMADASQPGAPSGEGGASGGGRRQPGPESQRCVGQ